MALPSSGQLSIGDIRTELGSTSGSLRTLSAAAGKSTPDSISEFYGYSNLGVSYTPSFTPLESPYTITGSGTSGDPLIMTAYNNYENFGDVYGEGDVYGTTLYFTTTLKSPATYRVRIKYLDPPFNFLRTIIYVLPAYTSGVSYDTSGGVFVCGTNTYTVESDRTYTATSSTNFSQFAISLESWGGAGPCNNGGPTGQYAVWIDLV